MKLRQMDCQQEPRQKFNTDKGSSTRQKYNNFNQNKSSFPNNTSIKEQRGLINQARGGAKISNFDEKKPQTYNDRFFANQKAVEENKSESVDDFRSKNSSHLSKKSMNSKRSKMSDSDKKALQDFLMQS